MAPAEIVVVNVERLLKPPREHTPAEVKGLAAVGPTGPEGTVEGATVEIVGPVAGVDAELQPLAVGLRFDPTAVLCERAGGGGAVPAEIDA